MPDPGGAAKAVAGEPIVELEGVGLRYRVALQRPPSFKEYAIHWVRGALRYQDYWALRDLTLNAGAGERIALIGRNGAGKTTLLRLIAGIVPARCGDIRIRGDVAPILGIESGFDNELTGVENLELVALLRGRTRREIRERFDWIVEFADLGNFIYSPVRTYSAGMKARLGFAVATAWSADIVLIDEVLAVGDASFVDRCRQRLDTLTSGGTTLFLVAHQADALREHCRRGIWLDGGKIRKDGPLERVLEAYETSL